MSGMTLHYLYIQGIKRDLEANARAEHVMLQQQHVGRVRKIMDAVGEELKKVHQLMRHFLHLLQRYAFWSRPLEGVWASCTAKARHCKWRVLCKAMWISAAVDIRRCGCLWLWMSVAVDVSGCGCLRTPIFTHPTPSPNPSPNRMPPLQGHCAHVVGLVQDRCMATAEPRTQRFACRSARRQGHSCFHRSHYYPQPLATVPPAALQLAPRGTQTALNLHRQWFHGPWPSAKAGWGCCHRFISIAWRRMTVPTTAGARPPEGAWPVHPRAFFVVQESNLRGACSGWQGGKGWLVFVGRSEYTRVSRVQVHGRAPRGNHVGVG